MQTLVITDNIKIKLPNGPVGINFSGGADSTILSYLVMSQLSVPVHFITMSTVDRGCAQHKNTSDVIAKLCEVTNNYNIEHHLDIEPDATHGIQNLFKLSKKLLYVDNVINSVLTGTTANPPESVLEKFVHKEGTVEPVERDPNILRPEQRMAGWYNPLTNLNKQDIMQLYAKHNLIESVFPLTKSCWTDYGKPPCNNCWFCEEREWGLLFNNPQ